MSDAMLHGVLNMPPELWTSDPANVIQRHARYMEASHAIRDLNKALLALSAAYSDWPINVSDQDEMLIRRLIELAEQA